MYLAIGGICFAEDKNSERARIVREAVIDLHIPARIGPAHTIAIGFHNGQSLLFDTDTLGIVALWHDGFLKSVKSGKATAWHVEGTLDWVFEYQSVPFVFTNSIPGPIHEPLKIDGRHGVFQKFELTEKGVKLSYRMIFPDDKHADVTESIEPADRGWTRRMEVNTNVVPKFGAPLFWTPGHRRSPTFLPSGGGLGGNRSINPDSPTILLTPPKQPKIIANSRDFANLKFPPAEPGKWNCDSTWSLPQGLKK
jgi:hypothetical protein